MSKIGVDITWCQCCGKTMDFMEVCPDCGAIQSEWHHGDRVSFLDKHKGINVVTSNSKELNIIGLVWRN